VRLDVRTDERSWAIAAAALAVAAAMRWGLDPWLGSQLPLVTFFAAVAVAAGSGGWATGATVTVVGYLVARWLFIDPRGTFTFVPAEIGRLLLYLLVCFVISGFGEMMRRTVERAKSAQRMAEEEAARRGEAEARFRLAADAVNGVIYAYDFRTRRVERTRGMFEVLGHHPEEVPPLPDWWEGQVHPDDRASRLRQFQEAADAGHRHITMRYRMRHKDGRWLHVEDRAVLVKGEAGQYLKMHGCTVDVTDLKEAEERLRRLNDELREADRRKDEFVATLAHELRNPLAPIRNAVRILQARGPRDADLERNRAVIDRQVAHMARLLEDLLDVSRITRGKLELRRDLVPLAHVIDAALETSRPAIEAGAHALRVAMPPGSLLVDADPVRLAQVFGNLLTNAAKYTERGGTIEMVASQEGSEVAVSVRDTGIGIAPEMLGRLFEMFSQAVPAMQRTQGGLGIGLSLAKGIVELHGGRIDARSGGLQQGSEFTVRLPLPQDFAANRGHVSDPRAAMVRLTRRVLVVDDNRDSADTLATLLEVLGCEVKVAYDGEEALRVGEGFKPDAVLLDLGMPRVNGFEACERMRAQPWGRAICIVALTGWGQEDDRKRTKEAGFDAHLVKPADPGKLTELLASISVQQPQKMI
jgi:two-component system CheB/CheR fusion protein